MMTKFSKWMNKLIKESEYFIHETKHKALVKFLGAFAVLLSYLLIVTFHYGVEQGLLVTALTWCFFVFCTPVADAGFLIDFPLRLITGIRMVYSELIVWTLAAIISSSGLIFKPEIFNHNAILILFKHILTKPWPFWTIIILSAIGTFLSIIFGDELIDVAKHHERKHYHKHKHKWRIIFGISIIVLTIITYYTFLSYYNLNF